MSRIFVFDFRMLCCLGENSSVIRLSMRLFLCSVVIVVWLLVSGVVLR